MRNLLLTALLAALALGCASNVQTASEGVEPASAAVPSVASDHTALAAADGSEYRNLAVAEYERIASADVYHIGYRYFFKPVQQGASPVGLHDYIQHTDMAEGRVEIYPGGTLGHIGGRYNVMPNLPVAMAFRFAEGTFEFDLEGTYYFNDDLAAGMFMQTNDVLIGGFNFYLFAKYAKAFQNDQTLFAEFGVRINDNFDDGIFLKIEYFFNPYLSAGIQGSTDVFGELSGIFGYRFANGFGINAVLGRIGGDFSCRVGGEYRF